MNAWCAHSATAATDPTTARHAPWSDSFEKVKQEYARPEVAEFARQASIQEFECYLRLPEGMTPRNPRVEETAQFAKKMGYHRLGIAFCAGLRQEAAILDEISGTPGVRSRLRLLPGGRHAQGDHRHRAGAEDRRARTNGRPCATPSPRRRCSTRPAPEFNIVVGLCVGHDSLFFKYANAPTTVLIAKDRVFGHNPVAGLYQSEGVLPQATAQGVACSRTRHKPAHSTSARTARTDYVSTQLRMLPKSSSSLI